MALFRQVPILGTSPFILFISTFIVSTNALDFCDQNYWCKEGHCCGNGRCCSYYYELWWFWLIWVLIALMSCCCFYQQRRLKKRRRRHRRHSSSRRERSSHSQHAQASTSESFFRPLFDPSKLLKLPTYEEVEDMPKDPPPYDILYATTLEETVIGGPSSSLPVGAIITETIQVDNELEELDDSPSASLLTNEEQVAVEVGPPPYSAIARQDQGTDSSATFRQPQELSDSDACVTGDEEAQLLTTSR